jgi:hypothetical protein
MTSVSPSGAWRAAVALLLFSLSAGCGTEKAEFEGRYILTLSPAPECALPSPLEVEVVARTLRAAGPGERQEVTLRPRQDSGIFALTVDLLDAGGVLRGGMTAGKEDQCSVPEEDCGVATTGGDPYRLHLEGIAEATPSEGRVASGAFEGDILLSSPGDERPDTLGACSSSGHRFSLEPLGERRRVR